MGKKLTKSELSKMEKQMNISSRKSIEERGSFPRPTCFEDKRAVSKKYAARKKIREYERDL